jgi:hypothetical protein
MMRFSAQLSLSCQSAGQDPDRFDQFIAFAIGTIRHIVSIYCHILRLSQMIHPTDPDMMGLRMQAVPIGAGAYGLDPLRSLEQISFISEPAKPI